VVLVRPRSDPGPDQRRLVRHFGPRVGEAGGGGMASVLASYAELDLTRYRLRFTTTASLHTRFKSAEFLPAAVGSLLHTAAQRAPRPVVHVHLSSGGSLIREGSLVRMGRGLGLPTVATMHASQLEHEVREAPRRLRYVLASAHIVHALGPASAGLIKNVLGDRTKVVVLPNCVTVPATASAAGDRMPHVLFAGEVSARKGADVLLEAWPRIRAAVPEATLLILGKQRGVSIPHLEGVSWVGGVARERVLAELDSCRVAVLPTRAEVQPMFILEAMAAGRPVVTTPVAEIPGMVGDGGELVTPGDASALADAIMMFLKDPTRATAIGAAGRERVQRIFSTTRLSRDLEQLYDLAVLRAARTTPRVRRVRRLGDI
jgi:glycosyltransferase involved in cell wall biosynthesis